MGKKSFGELIREIREDQRISMRSLASSADMDPAYLSRIENGKTGAPKPETVEKLADALCKEQQLGKGDCERLTRQLRLSSGHLLEGEDLIDDLSERFSDRLREEGFPEGRIDEALARVPLATMRRVLLGKENLEIGYGAEIPDEKVQAIKDAGEEVIMFDQLSGPEAKIIEPEPGHVAETASSYLDKHAEDFITHRRQQRVRASQDPQKIIRAGRDAEIRVHRTVNKAQEQQLRLIAKLINTIVEEKSL